MKGEEASAPRVNGLRWWIIGLVALATTINYVDRSALAIMWPDISAELGMTKGDYARIAVFFTVAYAVSQSLSGRLYDIIGTRAGFVVSIAVWSAAVALHALARGVASFSAFRVLLGLGEAGNWPGAVKSNAEWFPVKERALAQGIFNSGASVGSIISPILIALLYVQLGWQVTFVLLGGLGVLWIIPWLVVNRAGPEAHPWITAEERALIMAEAPATSDSGPRRSVLELLSTRRAWAVLASRFFLDPIWWLFVFWLPIYLSERFGFDIKQIGLFAWMPYVGAAMGSISGGALASALISRGQSVQRARRTAVSLGGLVMLPCLSLAAFASEPMVAVALITGVLFGFQLAIGNIQTLPSDLFTGSSVGTVAGLGGTTAAIGVVLTTWAVPQLTQTSYEAFFFLGAGLVPLGVACVFLFAHDAQEFGGLGVPEDEPSP
ncbi:MAG: MFS transporter [Myxococcota bacterium]